MRSIQIHPVSLVLGILFAGICFLSMSQVWPAGQHVLVSYGPDPRDMVQIQEGSPYTVPLGKLFVLTALGTKESTGSAIYSQFKVNGQAEVWAAALGSSGVGNATSLAPVASGLTVQGGSVAEPFSSSSPGSGRAWGYLAPQ